MAFYDEVHLSRKYNLGLRKRDNAGREFIYLKGISSLAAGNWVSMDEAHVTARAVANAKGRVAVAMAAVDANTKFGWFCIYGSVSASALTLFADNAAVYLTSTPGSVDDTDVSGDAVMGAIGRSAVSESTLLATFELSYPVVDDIAHD